MNLKVRKEEAISQVNAEGKYYFFHVLKWPPIEDGQQRTDGWK